MATIISTRALSPRLAVGLSAVLNFVGVFVSIEVADHGGSGDRGRRCGVDTIVFAGLIGAIAWNLVTWYFGPPSSSSHALIGGRWVRHLAAEGTDAVNGDGLVEKVLPPGADRARPGDAGGDSGDRDRLPHRGTTAPGVVNRGFRLGELPSGSMFSFAHGTNDAQKTMGIIVLALIAHGSLSAENFTVPTWVKVSAATAIALGTYVGGWRIIRTMGSRMITAGLLRTHTNVIHGGVTLGVEADSLNCSILGPDVTDDDPEFDLFVKGVRLRDDRQGRPEVHRDPTRHRARRHRGRRHRRDHRAAGEDHGRQPGEPRRPHGRAGQPRPARGGPQGAPVAAQRPPTIVYGDPDHVDAPRRRRRPRRVPLPVLLRATKGAVEPHDVEPFGPVSTVLAYDASPRRSRWRPAARAAWSARW